jgi:hypothetical protein
LWLLLLLLLFLLQLLWLQYCRVGSFSLPLFFVFLLL